jgi:hypothetical protein
VSVTNEGDIATMNFDIDFDNLLDLPTLGERLQEFADNLIPRLAEVSGVDEADIALEFMQDPWRVLIWYAEG